MLTPERHAMQHAGLAKQEARVQRIWQAQYDRNKQHRVHAPRKMATLGTRSHRVTLYYAWRAHVQGGHSQRLPTRINLDEIRALHDRLHAEDATLLPVGGGDPR